MATWVVTGASRGIGRAVAERVLRDGDRVVALSRKPDPEGWPAGHADRVLALAADVTDPRSLDEAARVIEERCGRVDVLVNNAGLHRGGKVSRLPREDWDAVLATNLTGPLEVTRRLLPLLGEGASIVNVGAVVGLRGFPGDAAYATSKAGLSGLTQVLAVELAPRGVRANLVIPGLVDTEMTSQLSARARQRIVDAIPLGRAAAESEIAEVICWVARATYMTGAIVPVDGGLLATFGGTTAPRAGAGTGPSGDR